MRLSIEPIGPQFRESLKEHLGPFGLPPDIVEWKYFQRPWTDALSGLVWVKDGRVRGAIGLIPFHVKTGSTRVPASWTCDWVVESPQSNPGIGVLLLQRAKQLAGPLFSLGGNELNRRLMARIATTSFDDAAIEVYLPLRTGGSRWFRGLNRRTGGVLRPAAHLPVRRIAGGNRALVVPGVSPAIEAVIESMEAGHPTPLYTLDYLRWQLEQCPGVESATVLAESPGCAAGALCWSRMLVAGDWRFALWSNNCDGEAAGEVLEAVIAYAYARGGERISVLSSRLDERRLALFRRRGFVSDEPGRPLFVTGDVTSTTPLAGLSFLDTDLAYRV